MNEVVSLGVGSVGGAVVSELLKLVIEEAKMVLAFKSVYKELASTMEEVLPIIIEIEMLQSAGGGGGSGGELKNLNDVINEALLLVRKCSQVKRWNLPSKARYTRKIDEINKKMLKFCQIQLQLILLRNQRLIMMYQRRGRSARKPSDRLSQSHGRLDVDTMKAIDSHLGIINKKLQVLSVSPIVYRDLCSVPKIEYDKVLFGLDLPLMEVKKKLLDDHVVSLVVSAPPGCGKTTLVTQLCHDDDIKERFEHIFFSLVSTAPNFRTIVQSLLQYNGYEALTFENDSQAVVGLRNLLDELKEDGPILLVLDDVWLGAESFLQKFQINIVNFKILVTSRFDFPIFGPTYHLKPLGDEDAMSLLIQHISLLFTSPTIDLKPLGVEDAKSLVIERASSRYKMPPSKFENHCQKILKCCYGIPLLIEVIGVSLMREARKLWRLGQVESWSNEETILDNPHPTVLECLQPRFNVLKPHLKECFLDMGSFLEDQKIRASVIVDIWMELYGEEGSSSSSYMKYLNNFASKKNLLKLIPPGNEQEDGFYNEFLVTQHDILRELALCQSIFEENHERKRLNLEIRDDKFPDWCLDLMHPINARLLSISTDDLFSSTWVEMECPNVEALVLNLSSSNYALPNFITTMKKLKVVIIINHGLSPAKLTNLSCLSSLPNLKRIRLERISITMLDILQSGLGSLEKLYLFMCSFGEVFYDIEKIVVTLPSLHEIDIDYCYDFDELPYWVFELVSLKTLSITNCNNLTILPEALGNLSKLEVLRLSSCFNLSKLPETIERLGDLRFLDISYCLGLRKFPSGIGKLHKLKKISMRYCSGCDLPDSVKNLEDLTVKCDQETGLLWESLKPQMRNLRVFNAQHSYSFLL